jgi:hypothetical protein
LRARRRWRKLARFDAIRPIGIHRDGAIESERPRQRVDLPLALLRRLQAPMPFLDA